MLNSIGIVLFLTLPMLVYPRPEHISIFEPTDPAIKNFMANVVMVLLFYSNYFYLIPRFFLRKRYVPYAISLILALALVILIPAYVSGVIPWEPPPNLPDHFGPEFNDQPGGGPKFGGRPPSEDNVAPANMAVMTSSNLLLCISVVLFSILLRVREQWFAAEREKNYMELWSLKERMNPHFLFNTLNSVYVMSMAEDATKTGDALLKLSSMMRYVIGETTENYVPIVNELQYIDDFIALQRQRLNPEVKFSFQKEGQIDAAHKIAPLLMIPFIENAFKHGVNPDEDSEIRIVLSFAANQLTLECFNRKVNVSLPDHERSGKGLEVTKERLSRLYPGRYSLTVQDDDDAYKVILQLKLHA